MRLTVPPAVLKSLRFDAGQVLESNGMQLTLWAADGLNDRYYSTEYRDSAAPPVPVFGDPAHYKSTLRGNLCLSAGSVRELRAVGELAIVTPFGTLTLVTDVVPGETPPVKPPRPAGDWFPTFKESPPCP